jgi:hypothetical protein
MGEAMTWIVSISGVLASLAVGWLSTVLARRSQRESNAITAGTAAATVEDLKFKQYRELLGEVQEERDNANRRADTLIGKVDVMDKFMREHFAGYRAYIHVLRGQVFDLGGIPAKWPENLEQ